MMKKRNYKYDNGAEMFFTYFVIKDYLSQLEEKNDASSNIFKMVLGRTKQGLENCMDTWGIDYNAPAIYDARAEEE